MCILAISQHHSICMTARMKLARELCTLFLKSEIDSKVTPSINYYDNCRHQVLIYRQWNLVCASPCTSQWQNNFPCQTVAEKFCGNKFCCGSIRKAM